MAADERTSRRARFVGGCRRGRATALGVLMAAGVGTACAQEADPADVAVGDVEYEATAEYLAAAADRSRAQPYRMEMRESLAGRDDVVVETGEQDGRRFHLRQDLAAPLGDALPNAADVDLSIEMAGDGSTLYLRLPKRLASGSGAIAIAPFGDLMDRLQGGWGRVDLEQLADLLPGPNDAPGAVGPYDPRVFVDVITKSKDVEALGRDEIRGVPVNGLAAEVPFDDLIAAPDTEAGGIGAMTDTTVPVEVWVDRDGLVRRVSVGLGPDAMAETLGPEAHLSSFPVDVDYTVDLFDYGDESIVIELPAEAVDVTDAFREMLETMDRGLLPAGET